MPESASENGTENTVCYEIREVHGDGHGALLNLGVDEHGWL